MERVTLYRGLEKRMEIRVDAQSEKESCRGEKEDKISYEI